MAFRFVALFALMAVASAGVIGPVSYAAAPAVPVAHRVFYKSPPVDTVASTHQNVVRSFDGTVSTYSKAIDTPYSSVRKEDTRINNNVYSPAYAQIAAPAFKNAVYAAPAAAVYEHHQATVPAVLTNYAQAAPAQLRYPQAVPLTATTAYNHGPAASSYTHNAPGLSSYGSSQTVHYSPAELVSHMSFDGFGTHWGF